MTKLKKVIACFETIAEVTVKDSPRARWVYSPFCGGFYKCSRCGHDEALKKPTCPECGAIMEEDRHDEE